MCSAVVRSADSGAQLVDRVPALEFEQLVCLLGASVSSLNEGGHCTSLIRLW